MAFRVYDSQPDKIVALDTRRDASLKRDDQVCVELDPFLSYREVSDYCINARGTVSDSIAGGRASQQAWKGTWDGAARRTPYGWSAEMAIPFEILNYEAGTTTFGVNFLRYHNRSAQWSRWADTTVQHLPEECGCLTGLSPPRVAQRSPLTAMPYVLGGRNIPDEDGDIKTTLVTAGIDIRYDSSIIVRSSRRVRRILVRMITFTRIGFPISMSEQSCSAASQNFNTGSWSHARRMRAPTPCSGLNGKPTRGTA
jgi:hypothetical protein